ncbi:MAG: very short patch repair endonuclease [Verrucomicrobiales bacterium]|nr:very short patch repair endonuclease [Verrucomicrobiales bacterium]
MADIFTKAGRSKIMSLIRSKGNKDTELRLMKIFRKHRITGWRRNRRLFGKPDFVFPARRLAVFVDGCYWHGCPKHCRRPATNRKFWNVKIDRNQARDRKVNRELRQAGWRVLRIWEHALARKQESHTVKRVLRALDY